MHAKYTPAPSRAVPMLIGAGFLLRLTLALRAGIIEHDGALLAPEGPGWGVEPDPAFVKRFTQSF